MTGETVTRTTLAAALLALAGCRPPPPAVVPVSGTVTLDGEPLPNARVTFTPMIRGYGAEYAAAGVTDADGRFTLACPAGGGAAVAENRVTVADAPGPENTRGAGGEAQAAQAKYLAGLKNRPIPPEYRTLNKTPLVVVVTAGQSEYRIELKR